MTKPVKITNLSSKICCVNLIKNQSLQITIPYEIEKIKTNSPLLKINKINNFLEIEQSPNLRTWNFSNLYLGNIDLFCNNKNFSICTFLDNKSELLTAANIKYNKFKIKLNQILEIVVSSNSSSKFACSLTDSKILGYKIFNNQLLSEYFQIKEQHHIWIKFCSVFFGKVFFSNKKETYEYFINVTNNKVKNSYYIREVNLAKKD